MISLSKLAALPFRLQRNSAIYINFMPSLSINVCVRGEGEGEGEAFKSKNLCKSKQKSNITCSNIMRYFFTIILIPRRQHTTFNFFSFS